MTCFNSLKKDYICACILFTCFMLFGMARAQQVDDIPMRDIIYARSHTGLFLQAGLAQKAVIHKNTGMYDMTASNQVSFEAGVDRYYNINKSYSVIFGLHGGATGRNFLLYLSKDDFQPPTGFDDFYDGGVSRDMAFYISVPLWLERRWIHNKHSAWNIDLGVNLRFVPADSEEGFAGYIVDNGQWLQDLDMRLHLGNNGKPWLNYNVAGGYSMILKNYNLLKINIVANLSFTKFVNGTYKILVRGQPDTEGTYGVTGTALGLSASYIFTGAKKRMAKTQKNAAAL